MNFIMEVRETDDEYEQRMREYAGLLNGGMIDTLYALVRRGPLYDGDVPSKSGRDELIEMGLACKIIVKGEDGYQAATPNGKRVFNLCRGRDMDDPVEVT